MTTVPAGGWGLETLYIGSGPCSVGDVARDTKRSTAWIERRFEDLLAELRGLPLKERRVLVDRWFGELGHSVHRWAWYHDPATGEPRDWYCEDVLSGRSPVEKVFEDDRVLAFHHPDPEARVHVVVVPKEHVPSIIDPKAVEPPLAIAMVHAVQEVARILGLDRAGLSLEVNAASPGVTPHMHWHLMGPGPPP